ncbi:hypothetical protein E2C01_024314 [Portunus trituberculatus]|uniref:Uncharacterized protein n=1 Tax=Portunus trituberculatus TaxID=210409 RepID=A0A5B7EBY6_PORTR|nr:hypothetical protein [Portunus trituberculatus]
MEAGRQAGRVVVVGVCRRRVRLMVCQGASAPRRQAERCYLPEVRKAQGPHHGRKVLLGEQGRRRGRSRRQHAIWAHIRRLERSCGSATPQEDSCRIPEVRREVGGAGGGWTRRSGLEVRHSLPQHRKECQGLSPGRPRCRELARKPQILPVDQLRRRVMHVLLLRGPPACGPVYTGEEVPVDVARWKGTNQIYVDCVEAFRGCGNGLEWRAGVAVSLGGLARKAGANPLFNFLSHSWPHRSPADDAVHPQDARMVERVAVAEDLLAERPRHI